MSGIINQGFKNVEQKINEHELDIVIPIQNPGVNVAVNNIREEANNEIEELPRSMNNKNEERKSQKLPDFFSKNSLYCKYFMIICINILVVIHFIFATLHWKQKDESDCDYDWCNGYGLLIILISLIYGSLIYYYIVKQFLQKFIAPPLVRSCNFLKTLPETINSCWNLETIILSIISGGLLIFIVVDSLNDTQRLMSLVGTVVLTFITWIFSKYRRRVFWRPVITGFLLQVIIGLLVVRWSTGREILNCISDKIARFLNYSVAGTSFVYSEELVSKNIFAFSAIPVIFFMSFIVQVLYYLGVMQWVIMKLGWVLQKAMGTTVCESMNASANIFLGMTESPLLIRPYLKSLTESEIHAVMCCGFATVSGTVMAAYISFGAEASHLISASVMSAPAALCLSKLFYPETEQTLTSYKNIRLEKSEDTGILDAATKGALAAIPLVLNIIANIVAFVSFVAFCDGMLGWIFGLIGYSGITFQVIMAKVFMPLAYIIGIPWDECEKVGELIGIKTVINEFVAYQQLGVYKKNNLLSLRSQAIATYALCGFSNPASVGILIGCLTSMAPEKTKEVTRVAIRAFVAGSIVCFLTACIAGVLITEDFYSEKSREPNSTNSVL